MQVDVATLGACVEKAAELQEQYVLYVRGAGALRKSMDDFVWICGEYSDLPIVIFELPEPVPHSSIRSHYIKFDDRYEIYLQPIADENMRRFVLCKELFHVILDEPKCRNPDVGEHLDQVFVAFSVIDSTPGPTVVSEQLAEVAAMEFLFPYMRRIEELNANPVDYAAIAAKYGIPQVYIEQYLSELYMNNFKFLRPAGE